MKCAGLDLHKKTIVLCVMDKDRKVQDEAHQSLFHPNTISIAGTPSFQAADGSARVRRNT
jgi:hypothetical protein